MATRRKTIIQTRAIVPIATIIFSRVSFISGELVVGDMFVCIFSVIFMDRIVGWQNGSAKRVQNKDGRVICLDKPSLH
jgi:hypothetical protein